MTDKKKTTAKVGGVISNGEGGYYAQGDTLPNMPKATTDSLKAKGYI